MEIFIPDNDHFRFIYDLGLRAAQAGLSILIEGETGTGKMMLADYIHQQTKPLNHLVTINCGGIHSETLASYLFGHVEGAYTDARNSRVGKLQLAHKGILFMDEIGNMPLEIQAKILTAIETKSFEPLGSNEKISSDFLLISATNSNLQKEAEKGNFRVDLLYRIRQVHIHMPTLRDHKDVIPQFAHFFLSELNAEYGKKVVLSDEKMRELVERPWYGNVRELYNELKTYVALGETGHSVFIPFTSMGVTGSLNDKLSSVEKEEITKVLQQTKFNVSKAALILNMKRPTLIRRMKELDIRRDYASSGSKA